METEKYHKAYKDLVLELNEEKKKNDHLETVIDFKNAHIDSFRKRYYDLFDILNTERADEDLLRELADAKDRISELELLLHIRQNIFDGKSIHGDK